MKTQRTMNATELYEIRVAGHLSERWAAWYEGLSLRHEPVALYSIDCLEHGVAERFIAGVACVDPYLVNEVFAQCCEFGVVGQRGHRDDKHAEQQRAHHTNVQAP